MITCNQCKILTVMFITHQNLPSIIPMLLKEPKLITHIMEVIKAHFRKWIINIQSHETCIQVTLNQDQKDIQELSVAMIYWPIIQQHLEDV
ncbi:hypothetical protein DAPPUDRAFT_299874 [Daphnia pulex]|uniref:Uncharacterized protein n=1 Tax=Daphnia pulex TaxID=6669 RepID=E9FQR3_DAPPU|nr:hypothetical protein DAPPUDRAFT_299874 [Daphnia pulex]|eukprot:EFX90324.1 hypothetical protein DAPPUDRAFT_299874 [Daphnia pulex]